MLGFRLPLASAQHGQASARRGAEHELNAWIVVRADDVVIVRVARSEMGQGTVTGLAQLAAEEVGCRWSQVRCEFVRPDDNLRRGNAWGRFATGSSRSIRQGHATMRKAGVAARLMLIAAAARIWNVAEREVSVQEGVLRHIPTRRTLTFGRVAETAAKLPPPEESRLTLTDSKVWTLIGKPLNSVDAHGKVDGSIKFGIDVALPDMLSAAVVQAPIPGGTLASFDAAAAEKMPGVKRVLAIGDEAVAVVAQTWWQARAAASATIVTWNPAPEVGIDDASIDTFLKSGLDSEDGFVGRTHGDALAALRASAKTLDVAYATPFLHHATLEPMNATALWQTDRLDVWVPTQNAEAALVTAAEAAGLAQEQVVVHRTAVGGAFGRRLKHDYLRQAVLIARAMPGTPVKLIWSREEDTTHGYYRPVTQARLRAGIDAKGEPTGLIIRISGQSILATNLRRDASPSSGRDPRMFQGLYAQPGDAQLAYSVPNLFVDHAMRNTHMPVGSWRGVHSTQNGVYIECFIDELADAAKRDPLEFRRSLMKGHPRHLAVLNAAAEAAGWVAGPASGVYRGLAQTMAVGSYAAVVAEVVRTDSDVRVARIVVALDCGHVVNPRLVEAQVEGAVAMGLSATLYEKISIAHGRVVEQNFDTYRVLKLAEYPVVQTVLVPSGEVWGGVGDAVIASVAPATLNAVFRATGKRVRRLPLRGAAP